MRSKSTRRLAVIWQRLRDRRHDRISDSELRRLPENDLARFATDVGVSAGELRALSAKGSRASDLLSYRIKGLGLDSLRIARDPATMRDLQRVCALCTYKRRCKRDLDRTARQLPGYCPNVDSLRTLLAA